MCDRVLNPDSFAHCRELAVVGTASPDPDNLVDPDRPWRLRCLVDPQVRHAEQHLGARRAIQHRGLAEVVFFWVRAPVARELNRVCGHRTLPLA